MVRDETGQAWRWRRVGDPVLPQLEGVLTAGELSAAGVTITAFQAARPERCPVCGTSARLWRATMELPSPMAHPLVPGPGGCTPEHAAAGAPTSWAGVAARLAADAEDAHGLTRAGDAHLEGLAGQLAGEADTAAFLATCTITARRLALQLWADDPGLGLSEVATTVTGVLVEARPASRSPL